MTAVIALARHMWRRQLVGFVSLGIIGGLGMGFAMTAAEGSRRADSAYDRLRSATLAPDFFLEESDLDDSEVAKLGALDNVSGIGRLAYAPVAPAPLTPGEDAGAFVGLDADSLTAVYRPLVISGRLARIDATDEVVINEVLAKVGNFRAGQRVPLLSGFSSEGEPRSIGDATIVGVVRGIFDVGAVTSNPFMLLGKAFMDSHRDTVQVGGEPFTLVRFVHGESDFADFQRSAASVLGRDLGSGFPANGEAVSINRTLTVQTIGLGLLAAVAFVVTIAAAMEALSRILDRAFANLPVLIALGFEPRHRRTLGALLAAPVALIGVVVGCVAALLGSPLVPTGFARAVDPISGIHLDPLVTTLIALAWLVLLLGIGVVVAWLRWGRPERRRSQSWMRRSLAPLPVRMRLGCEAALVPARGRAAAASRSALVAGIFAVLGVTAVGTFGVSLGNLVNQPALYGWNFDASFSQGDGSIQSLQQALSGLEEDDAVSQLTWVSITGIDLDGQAVEVFAFDQPGALIHPTMRFGHPPLADDEIVVGADFYAAAHVRLGDTIRAAGPDGEVQLRVVGSATYPELGNNSDLANNASITLAAARRLGAPEQSAVALIRMTDGADVSELKKYTCPNDCPELVLPNKPSRVRNLQQVGAMPWVLGGFLVALGLLAVGHAFWRSLLSRRRHFSILGALGFGASDVRAIVLWQAASIAVVAVAIGLPAGIIVGRQVWSRVALATGVVNRIVAPVGWIALGALVVLMLCLAIAAMMRHVVGRYEIAAGLSAEQP